MQLPITAQTATAMSAAAAVATDSGIITSESLTTIAGANATLTIGCPAVTASSLVMASVQSGTNTGGVPAVRSVTPATGKVTILVGNTDGAAAFNGTVIVSFIVFN